MLRTPGVVGVFENVTAAVDARPLAVPHREDAVELRLRKEMQLLRAPYGGGRDVLVDARLEADVARLEEGPGGVQRGVQPAQRRAPVAGDVAGGMQAGGAVHGMLQHGQPSQGLHAGEEDPTALEPVLVFERNVCNIHLLSPLCWFARLGAPSVTSATRAGSQRSTSWAMGWSGAVRGGAPPGSVQRRDAVGGSHELAAMEATQGHWRWSRQPGPIRDRTPSSAGQRVSP